MSMANEVGNIPVFTKGDRLRKARELTGLSSYEFADHIGVSQKTINNAESNRTATRKIVMNAWSLATGVPVEWLETGHTTPDDDGRPRRESNARPRDYKVASSHLALIA